MKNQDIETRIIPYGGRVYQQELELRNRLLRLPLGLNLYDEELEGENGQLHIGAFLGDELVGVLVLTDIGEGVVQMRQVAVEEGMQGRGIGKKMVLFAEEQARQRGFRRMVLHARQTAVKFYTSMDYHAVGDEFTEVGIPHLEMTKDLSVSLDIPQQ